MDGPRGARADEVREIIDLADRVFRNGENAGSSMGSEFPLLFSTENAGNLRIIREDNAVVSHVGVWPGELSIFGCTTGSGSIGAVCTDPDYRRRGYATRLVADAIDYLRNGNRTILFVSGNRTLYRNAGCREAGRNWHYTISSDSFPAGQTSPPFIREVGGEAIEELTMILQAEPVRYQRSVDEFRSLVTADPCGRGLGWTPYLLAVELDGHPLAYIYLRKRRDGDAAVGRIIEYAGNRNLIQRSLPVLMERYSLDRLYLEVQDWDRELAAFMNRMYTGERGTILGTIRVLDFNRLMDDLRPYWMQRMSSADVRMFEYGATGENAFISFGSRRLNFTDAAGLTRFLFGVGGAAEEPVDRETLPPALQRVFPLPLPNPGCLNYI